MSAGGLWQAKVIEGGGQYLADELNELEADGWAVRHVTPHGIGAWTVVSYKANAYLIVEHGKRSFWHRLRFLFNRSRRS